MKNVKLRMTITRGLKLVVILMYFLTPVIIHAALSGEDDLDRLAEPRMPLLGFSYRMMKDYDIPAGPACCPVPGGYVTMAKSR